MSHHLPCPLPYHCRDLSHPAAWCISQVFVELNQYTWLSLDNYDPLIINSPLPPSSFALRKCPQTRSIPSLQQLGRTSTLRLHILSLPFKETRSKNNAWHHHPHTSQQRRHCCTPSRCRLWRFFPFSSVSARGTLLRRWLDKRCCLLRTFFQ